MLDQAHHTAVPLDFTFLEDKSRATNEDEHAVSTVADVPVKSWKKLNLPLKALKWRPVAV
tara:strand:- start:494 stop:673 length:180 start_codon:yes stop_codon:yes gene_type:complete